MKIAIGCDHAGVRLKDKIKAAFPDIEFLDMGTNSEESTDYPDHIAKVARAVQEKTAERGIGICGTGIGASITANKHRGIRAALCGNEFMAEMSRMHNDSNMLILGSRVTGEDLSFAIVRRWIATGFEGGRHQRRLDKIAGIENGQCGGNL
ncbi:MAG: ribose 5-phosphate isomerase B [Spirochaetes bacterium]|nr:MAG: ribose 5-phosphate isomerase B [Spirochaetota bacterium]